MEICVGRHVLAPNVWAREAEIYDATVRLGAAAPVAAIAAALARIDAALPQRRDIFGVFTPTDAAAGEGFRTDQPRLLGQLALTLQSQARPPATSASRSPRTR